MREAISVHAEAIRVHSEAISMHSETISMHSGTISMHSEHLGAENRQRHASDIDAVEDHRALVDGVEPREQPQ